MTVDLTLSFARALVQGLLDAGVQRFFVSPGSRSTPWLARSRTSGISGIVCLHHGAERTAQSRVRHLR